MGIWPNDHRLFSYPLLIYKTTMHLPRSLYVEKISKYLHSSLSASLQLAGSIRIDVKVKALWSEEAYLQLHVSQLSRSPKDYYNFYGLTQPGTDIPYADDEYSSLILRQLENLPTPFDLLLEHA